MSAGSTVVRERPVRWDHPLDPEMLHRDIGWLLAQPPFSELNPNLFLSHGSLANILRHDARILRCEPGDLIVREGDYGSSAFVVLRGSVRAFLVSLWEKRGRPESSAQPGIFHRLKRWIPSDKTSQVGKGLPEGDQQVLNRRHTGRRNAPQSRTIPVQQVKTIEGRSRIFLQDIEAVVEDFQSEPLGPGHIFGEMAAITRSPHRFTVLAETPTVVLEIRWQGLRILRRDAGFKEYLDERYRRSGLQSHLRETSLFRFLDESTIEQLASEARLESYGDMEWFAEYKHSANQDIRSRIEHEPVIAIEGTEANDLYLIRAGFARVSFEHGHGHQTVAYLGRGQMFGLEELAQSFRNTSLKPLPYQASLRALGFVDVIRIPRGIVTSLLFPQVRRSELPPPILQPRYDAGGRVVEAQRPAAETPLETPLLEFLVDERLINGQQTMLIDLDRCTGCDECIKACATTHQGIPRFIRNGPQYGPLMFAHACMHCVDPVCMIGCPTGAIARNPDSGVISIDPNTCIGCKTCSESCPYENIVMIQLVDQQGRTMVDKESNLPILQASKCDLCQKLTTGPACQNACPHQALFRIDTSDTKPFQAWLSKKVA